MVACWVYTLHNWTEEEHEILRGVACGYHVVGKEISPTTGRPHLQGYIRFNQKTLKRDWLGMIGEIARRIWTRKAEAGPDENREYCTKQGDFWEGGELRGEHGGPRPRTDLDSFKEAIKEGMSKLELYDEFPKQMALYPRFYEGLRAELNRVAALQQCRDEVKPEVTVLWGEPGSGKTRQVFEDHAIEDIYKVGVAATQGEAMWWDGYEGQDIILIDDYYGQYKPEYILNLLDRYPMRLNVKGGFRYRIATKIYITSNVHPSEWYANGNVPASVRRALMRRLDHVVEINL